MISIVVAQYPLSLDLKYPFYRKFCFLEGKIVLSVGMYIRCIFPDLITVFYKS